MSLVIRARTSRVRERGVHDLVVEILSLLIPDEMRAYVFVTGVFRRLGLVSEAIEEGLCDLRFEIGSRKLAKDLVANVFGKCLVPDAERIQRDTVVQELHFQRLVCGDAGRGMKRYCIPGGLDAGVRNAVVFEKLTHCVRAIDFEAIVGAAELLGQTKVVEGDANEQKLDIELLSCLAPHLVGPEEPPMRMVDQNRLAEFSQ